MREMLKVNNDSFDGKKVTISGSGNVAIYAMEKTIELGGKVIAMSDSSGYVYSVNGLNLDFMKEVKETKRLRIEEYIKLDKDAIFSNTGSVWDVSCDIALPCATQNELEKDHAELLVRGGLLAIAEGANVPYHLAVEVFQKNKIPFGAARHQMQVGLPLVDLKCRKIAYVIVGGLIKLIRNFKVS